MSTPYPAPPFRITNTSIDGATHLTVRGELDIHTAPQLRDALEKAAAKGGTLILDTEDLNFSTRPPSGSSCCSGTSPSATDSTCD